MGEALSDVQAETFEMIRESPTVALVGAEFDGGPAGVIVSITMEDGVYCIEPVAVLLDEGLLQRVTLDGEPPETR